MGDKSIMTARQNISEFQKAEIIGMRSRYSHAEIARALGISVGSVKSIIHRYSQPIGISHADLIQPLDPLDIPASLCREIAVPMAPEKITGIPEIDAVLNLRRLIETGSETAISQALELGAALVASKDKQKEIERRYMQHLQATGGNAFIVALSSLGFADLPGLVSVVRRKRAAMAESLRYFADINAAIATQPAEQRMIDILADVGRDGKYGDWSDEAMDRAFRRHPDIIPPSLTAVMAEVAFWARLYELRRPFFDCYDELPEVQARGTWLYSLLATIPPRSRAEALAVVDWLESRDLGHTLEHAIMRNLIR